MKILFLALASLFATWTEASPARPMYCSQEDLVTMQEVWAEFEANGIDEQRLQLQMGLSGGDCVDAYSLERSAGRKHKLDAPQPTCGIIFILDVENQRAQATWILDTLGKRYETASGRTLAICSKIKTVGPLPGVTVHN